MEPIACRACFAPLQPDDPHTLCPSCLGVSHLREALSDPCVHCATIPFASRQHRLASVLINDDAMLSSSGSSMVKAGTKRSSSRPADEPAPKRKAGALRSRLDRLEALVTQLQSHQLPAALQLGAETADSEPVEDDDDLLSTAATDSLFTSGNAADYTVRAVSLPRSPLSAAGSPLGSGSVVDDGSALEDTSPLPTMVRATLARLGSAPAQPTPSSSAYFKLTAADSPALIPPCSAFVGELQSAFLATASRSRPSSLARSFWNMSDAAQYGLDRIPPLEPSVASLVVSPDEALRFDVRCPSKACRRTDEGIAKAYNHAARIGRLDNTISHLLLEMESSPQLVDMPSAFRGALQTVLHGMGFLTQEFGSLMASLVRLRRHLWLSQAPLSDACRTALRDLPLMPGQLFGPAATEALERRARMTETRQQQPKSHRSERVFTRPRSVLPQARSDQIRRMPTQLPLGAPPLERKDRALRADKQGQPVGVFTDSQLAAWSVASTDRWVLSTLSYGYRLQFRSRPPRVARLIQTRVKSSVHVNTLQEEICALIAKRAIEEVKCPVFFQGHCSKYFLVPKKDGGFRPILDLRGLNRHLKRFTFKMIRPVDVLQVIQPNEWFTTLDLKDAYFHIPIAAVHRRFLRFAFQNRTYQYRVLPSGLSLAPRVFTRCMAAALSPLTRAGMKILPYLDDWLICSLSRERAMADLKVLRSHVAGLGLSINLEKSSLCPSQSVQFIGMNLDSRAMKASLTTQRVVSILGLLSRVHVGRCVRYSHLLRLLGMFTAAVCILPLGLLELRPFQIWMNHLGLDPIRHKHRLVLIDQGCEEALVPWRRRSFLMAGVPLGVVASRREIITTDASLTGWGAVWQRSAVQGSWSFHRAQDHINLLELRAVYLALQHFLPQLQGRHVLVRSDNMTVVYNINHQGCTRSLPALRLARSILTWANHRLASLRAIHLAGTLNLTADFLSRQRLDPGEWCLHPDVVRQIWDRYAMAAVDLFASATTTHCPRWFSRMDEERAMGTDALAHEWPRCLLYAFPPIPLLLSVLLRIQQCRHSVLLVAPQWPARPWFPLLHCLLSSEPWPLPVRRDLLSQMGGRLWHPCPERLQLWVWPLGPLMF
ncbi:uncharacterized protein LOC125781314 [Astyanax mexicanus]|uniref:uncharacterized protein LOC125781314 n=1 Tax=Astyanax mexicanus TaxID=7994 RepID=UPI0020CABBC3|nr:uncharacterized protein LOC125781314 [Astyanax mexicanus]